MRMPIATLALCLLLGSAPGRALAQEAAAAGREVTAAEVRAAIDKLATIEFPVRMEAARTIRRAAAATAVPALTEAVQKHQDGYVRFRALVLLSGFNDPRTRDVMAQMLTEKNDRLRAVGYAYLEHHPDSAALPSLIQSLATEES